MSEPGENAEKQMRLGSGPSSNQLEYSRSGSSLRTKLPACPER